jgi:hypothetical protein
MVTTIALLMLVVGALVAGEFLFPEGIGGATGSFTATVPTTPTPNPDNNAARMR